MCHEGQLWPCVSDEKWSLSHAVSWRSVGSPREHFLICTKGGRPNVLPRNASWPDNPRSATRRAAQDLVIQMPENVTFWRISSPLMLGHSECWPGFLNAWLLQSVFKECSLASQVSGLRCSSSHSLLWGIAQSIPLYGAMLPPYLMVFLYSVLWSWTLYLLSAYGSKPIQRRAINCRAALSSLVRLSRTNIWRIFWKETHSQNVLFKGRVPIIKMEILDGFFH